MTGAMMRRSFIGGLLGALGFSGVRAEAKGSNSPVPSWKPSFIQPLKLVVDRLDYYSDGKTDFAVFRNGTCAILDSGLSDEDAATKARQTLAEILSFHPDMNPSQMDDGNILVRYNYPAANVVLKEVAQAHWDEIEKRHLDGLTPDEVLMTPLGPNKFDDFGKQALLGRAYMFMDAQELEVIEIHRHR